MKRHTAFVWASLNLDEPVSTFTIPPFFTDQMLFVCCPHSPVARPLRTPRAVERDVRCVPLVRRSIRAAAWVRRVSLCKSNYVKIIPMHMMIRETIAGRQFDGVLYEM